MREESSNMDNQCSAGHIHEDVTTTNERNINGSESQSVTEDNEQWSLQRLQRLMFDLEKKQSMSRKEVHFADLSSEILRLFWNEDFQELCETAKSDYYVNIMKEVKLYSGKRNSVIVQECRTLQDLDHVAEDLHNTRQNPVVPTVESESFQSSVLNPSDCNKSTAKVNNDEIRMERDENVKVPENYVAATSTQAQSQPLLTVHENNCSVEEDLARVLTDKSTDMDVEHKDDYSNRGPVETKKPVFDCLSKPTLTECPDNSKNVTVNSEKGEELPENKTARNEVSLVRSLNEQSLAMSDNCMHVNSEEDQPTTEMTCSLEDCNNADSTDCCSFLEINVLSPETAKKLYFTEPKKDVKTIHKDVSVETCTEKTDQVIVYHCDFIPEDDTQINTNVKLAKNNIGNDGAQQVKQYCCLAKWFQDLGYAFNVPCACKKNTAKRVTEESSNIPSDANTDNLEIEEVITDYEDVRKIASAISVHQMNEPLRTGGTREFKKGKPAHDSCKNKTTNHTSCSKLVAKSDLIPYLGQDLSPGDSSFPLTPTGSDLQVEEKDKKITTPEVQKEKRTVNLALFGLSSLNHNKTVGVTRNNPEKKTGFGIRSFDTEHFPPATLNVRVNNAVRLNNDAIGRQTAKQRILKSWQNSLAPTQMFPDKQWSRKLKNGSKSRTETADIFEIEKSITPTAFDAMKNLLSTQQHIQTHESEIPSPTEQQKTSDGQSKNKKHSTKRNKKKNRILDSISLTRRKKGLYAHNKSKSSASSVELPCPLGQSKHESSKRSMLDYRILPETFSFRDGGSLMKAHQSKDAAYGQKTETEMPKKRTVENLVIGVWCVSPKKKRKLKSTLPSSSSVSASTFQEFKKRYEEKKIVHPKTI